MTTVVDRWIECVVDGRTDNLADLLAEDAVFYSPAVFTPQKGRPAASAYLLAAERLFAGTGFHYVETWRGERSAVLEFAADIDGTHVEGVDIIHWNSEERIVSVKVMMRPLRALQAVIPRMADLLKNG